MDNNRSFSLHFNPLTNVRCVKDYEDEIAHLKTENFELKAQLAHSNIPKVLYENKQEMDALLVQKQEMQNSLDNLNKAYENILQEKRLLENKYSQELAGCNEKNSLLEDENKRLLLRLEKFNREIQETGMVKNELNELRSTIQNLEKQNEQIRYEYENHYNEIKQEYESFKREAETEVKNRMFEVENLKKKLDAALQKEKNSSFIISDLKATLNAQMRDKSVLDEMRSIETTLRTQVDDLQRQKQDCEFKLKCTQETVEKINKEHRIYLNGMDKFKILILQKLSGVSASLVDLSEKLAQFKAFCYISDENRNLMSKLKVKYTSLNGIIVFFKEKHAEIYRKMDVLKKEAANAAQSTANSKGGMDKKTQAILQEFKNQFGEAKNELLICKKYLDKKAAENKALRNENARLVAELQKKSKVFGSELGRINVMKI
ncbi:uncharacterized protein VICG_01245 [Vittaforma corneae ATCC 50505]|uniref:Uncharacterized protein n=1 Tax=Vittaforma corneae (strain ATCC 50505) TaxID=993615 RepID=L2GLL9_VITCO|nr:uncharacterized protein VICG_01245 [Vittaforma corneae ATCC 50505]ELA41741.1 hypothetical protein VICG_01245 [Vittaforma corneae ATCC 50505]